MAEDPEGLGPDVPVPEGEGEGEGEEEELPKSKLFARAAAMYWRSIIMVSWPIICLFIFVLADPDRKDIRCLYIVMVMAVYWVCEILPLGVTSMIPLVAWPLLGVAEMAETCKVYMSPTNVFFFAGLVLAISIEYCNLHRRIALKIMLCIGTTHRLLLLGFMGCTMFISMWVSNAAATAMMAPVALAVFDELEKNNLARLYLESPEELQEIEKDETRLPHPSRTARCYFLGITYAATIGGIGTLVGTATNLTYKGLFETKFTKAPEIDFPRWMAFNTPGMLVMTGLCWTGLCVQYLGLWTNKGMDEEVRSQKLEDPDAAKEAQRVMRDIVKERYQELGKWTFHQIAVGLVFVLIVMLWITRSPNIFPGWADVINPRLKDGKEVGIRDSVPGIFGVLLLFMIPASMQCIHCLNSDPEKRPKSAGQGLLTWKVVNQKYPWGLLWLLGGGFAMALGITSSGLDKLIGSALRRLDVVPPALVLFICMLFASMATELTSNVAVCNILTPIGNELAVVLKINPIYLTLPVAICCSFCFMLPVGTPCNAIVAELIHIRTKSMAVSGIWPTIETLLVVFGFWLLYGVYIYDLQEFPDWAKGD